MATVGSLVKHKLERTVGIVISWDTQNPGCVIYRFWSESKKKYVSRVTHPTHLMELEAFDGFEEIHKNAEGFKEAYNGIAAELSLSTNDREWFEQLFAPASFKKEGENV